MVNMGILIKKITKRGECYDYYDVLKLTSFVNVKNKQQKAL
jgi:hypothetical protein